MSVTELCCLLGFAFLLFVVVDFYGVENLRCVCYLIEVAFFFNVQCVISVNVTNDVPGFEYFIIINEEGGVSKMLEDAVRS